MDESIARSSKSVRTAVKKTLGVDFEDIDTNNFFIQMMIFKEAEDNALERMRKGIPTERQQEEADMKDLRDSELESYQLTTNFIASKKRNLEKLSHQRI